MFQCPNCKAKEEEIRYLRTLVDRLLEKAGVAPVDPTVPLGTQAFHHEDEPAPADRVGID